MARIPSIVPRPWQVRAPAEPAAADTGDGSDSELEEAARQEHGSDMLTLLGDPETSDIAIIVGERRFEAHRCILQARCEYFRAMFKSGLSDSAAKEVSLHDADPDALALLLRYIYSGGVGKCKRELLKPAINLADMLLLTSGSRLLQDKLRSSSTPDSIVDDMLWAEQAGRTELLGKLEEWYVGEHAPDVGEADIVRLAAASPKLMARVHMAVQR